MIKRNSINIIYGPMGSGKTTHLYKMSKSLEMEGFSIFKIKLLGESRYGKASSQIVTHNGNTTDAYSVSKNRLLNIISYIINQRFEIVFIDEIQFFNNVFEFCSILKDNGITVFAYGLLYDFRKNIFEQTAKLIEKADIVIEKNGKCDDCNNKSIHTRLNILPNGMEGNILVGELGFLYSPVCENCHSIPENDKDEINKNLISKSICNFVTNKVTNEVKN